MDKEKRVLVDTHDEENNRIVTLEEGKIFLKKLYDDDDDWESEDEFETWLEEIERIDNWEELDEKLTPSDYYIGEI